MDITTIENLILDYIEEVRTVIKNSKPLAGVFGLKGGVGDDPCHMKFYEKLSEALKEVDDPYQTVKLLIEAEKKYDAPKAATFMLSAIHGLAIPLVGDLDASQKAELIAYYDENVKKRDRLPVQVQLYKALKK